MENDKMQCARTMHMHSLHIAVGKQWDNKPRASPGSQLLSPRFSSIAVIALMSKILELKFQYHNFHIDFTRVTTILRCQQSSSLPIVILITLLIAQRKWNPLVTAWSEIKMHIVTTFGLESVVQSILKGGHSRQPRQKIFWERIQTAGKRLSYIWKGSIDRRNSVLITAPLDKSL